MMPLRTLALVAAAAFFTSGVATAQHCPPGQAKKGNCGHHDDRAYEQGYRDGHRDARWEIGHRLPEDVRYVVIRDYDYDRYDLRPPPRGHYYAEVDGRILLIQAATQLVLQALVR